MNTRINAERESTSKNAVKAYEDGTQHIRDELQKLDLLIQRGLLVFAKDIEKTEKSITTIQNAYISTEEVESLLRIEEEESLNTQQIDQLIADINEKINQRISLSLQQDVFLPLVHLAQVFEFTEFEYHALLICLAPEVRRKYDRLYAYLQDDISRKRPSRDLVLNLLCQTEEERWNLRKLLMPGARLLDACLLTEVEDLHSPSGSSDLAKFLALDTGILDFILGNMGLDYRLASVAGILSPGVQIQDVIAGPELKNRLIDHVRCVLDGVGTDERCTLICLSGPPGVGRRTLAASVCAIFEKPLLELDVKNLRVASIPVEQMLRLVFRDSLILQAPLFIRHLDILETNREHFSDINVWLSRMLSRYGSLVFASTDHPLKDYRFLGPVSFLEYTLPVPDQDLRESAWNQMLNKSGIDHKDLDTTRLAEQFCLTPGRIFDACYAVASELRFTSGSQNRLVTIEQLSVACRRQSHHRLSSLATKIKPVYSWQDIILPEKVISHLRAITGQVRYQFQVLQHWGFSRKLPYGRSLSVMFSGSPGTGKTMAAQVIAGELGLDLYKIDLSNVVSKYIGETEKNLSQIFQEAESGNNIILFDECDALFSKRTDVSDAHDRYANIEISYLLQRLEDYEGIVILATNLRNNIDEAFLRRIRFIVEFPFPDEKCRKDIWQSHIPPEAPIVEDIDFDLLARNYVISGGNIKNIVFNAAFLAAEERESIGMRHLAASAQREFEKIGKLTSGNNSTRPSLKHSSGNKRRHS